MGRTASIQPRTESGCPAHSKAASTPLNPISATASARLRSPVSTTLAAPMRLAASRRTVSPGAPATIVLDSFRHQQFQAQQPDRTGTRDQSSVAESYRGQLHDRVDRGRQWLAEGGFLQGQIRGIR